VSALASGGESALKITNVFDQLLRLAPAEHETEASPEHSEPDVPSRPARRILDAVGSPPGSPRSDGGAEPRPERETSNARPDLPDWILGPPERSGADGDAPDAPVEAAGSLAMLEDLVPRPEPHEPSVYEQSLSELERHSVTTVAPFVEAYRLGFHLGAAVDRIAFASLLGSNAGSVLRDAVWLIERHIELIEPRQAGALPDGSRSNHPRS
jgi:hypothetical protein